METIVTIAKIVLIFLICFSIGCTGRNGWSFHIGVAPVNGINNNQTFNGNAVKSERY